MEKKRCEISEWHEGNTCNNEMGDGVLTYVPFDRQKIVKNTGLLEGMTKTVHICDECYWDLLRDFVDQSLNHVVPQFEDLKQHPEKVYLE